MKLNSKYWKPRGHPEELNHLQPQQSTRLPQQWKSCWARWPAWPCGSWHSVEHVLQGICSLLYRKPHSLGKRFPASLPRPWARVCGSFFRGNTILLGVPGVLTSTFSESPHCTGYQLLKRWTHPHQGRQSTYSLLWSSSSCTWPHPFGVVLQACSFLRDSTEILLLLSWRRKTSQHFTILQQFLQNYIGSNLHVSSIYSDLGIKASVLLILLRPK